MEELTLPNNLYTPTAAEPSILAPGDLIYLQPDNWLPSFSNIDDDEQIDTHEDAAVVICTSVYESAWTAAILFRGGLFRIYQNASYVQRAYRLIYR